MKDTMVRFIDCHVPTETCNLRCTYCYITQKRKFANSIGEIGHAPEEIRKALSKKRLGGVAFINFCAGGETLFGEDILPVVYALLEEGHYVQIVTNGTMSRRFKEIAGWPQHIIEKLFIKFSFHYMELKRMKMIDRFFDNVITVREAGCSISLEITPCDELVPHIEDIKQISLEKAGAFPHITVARNENTAGFEILSKYDRAEYTAIWESFQSEMFSLKMKLLSEKREEFCYGGEWTFYLHLGTGELKQCYRGMVIDNIYEDISKPLHFKPVGKACPEQYCYNGHAWMTLGCISGADVPTYAHMRNRLCTDGSQWLTPKVLDFFSQKLENAHVVYKNYEKGTKSRVVLLGDSICEGYRENVEKELIGLAEVYYPYENARFSTYLLRYIQEWANKMEIGTDIDVVHFNVGLWDVLRINGDEPLVSIEEYEKNLVRICERIRYTFPNAKIIFATTTPVVEEKAEYSLLRRNEEIAEYNRCARSVMEEENIAIDDLYQITKEYPKDMYADWTHFNEQGFELLGKAVTDCIIRNIVLHSTWSTDVSKAISDSELCQKPSDLYEKRVIIYGAGTYGRMAIELLKAMGIEPYVICDSSAQKQNSMIEGIKIISPEEYRNNHCLPERDILIIAIKNTGVIEDVVRNFMHIADLTIGTAAALSLINLQKSREQRDE